MPAKFLFYAKLLPGAVYYGMVSKKLNATAPVLGGIKKLPGFMFEHYQPWATGKFTISAGTMPSEFAEPIHFKVTFYNFSKHFDNCHKYISNISKCVRIIEMQSLEFEEIKKVSKPKLF